MEGTAGIPCLEEPLRLFEALAQVMIGDPCRRMHLVQVDSECGFDQAADQELGLGQPQGHLRGGREDAVVLNGVTRTMKLKEALLPGWCAPYDVDNRVEQPGHTGPAFRPSAQVLGAEADRQLPYPVHGDDSKVQPKFGFAADPAPSVAEEHAQPTQTTGI
ncbi:MAG: hypothetical protein ACRDPE_20335 [Solirubrobacterales bacterium]